MPARPPRPAAALLAALCLALLLALPAARAQAAPDLLFGAYTDKDPYSGGVANVDRLQRALDRDIGIVNWYQNWGARPGRDWISQVQPSMVAPVVDSGRVPLITWEPWDPARGPEQRRFRLARLADGAFDGYVARFARDLRDLGTPVYLRPMHEMNGTAYPWSGTVNGNTAADYRAAWRHLHRVFARAGATNVRWVWSPVSHDAPAVPRNRMERYYPGARYVDVLAVDGYNWGATAPEHGGWQTFAEVFGGAYARLSRLGDQPIWIAEVGSAPEGGDKGRWVRAMFATAARWSRLRAIVWFDLAKEKDWRAVAAAPAFSATHR